MDMQCAINFFAKRKFQQFQKKSPHCGVERRLDKKQDIYYLKKNIYMCSFFLNGLCCM
jgi:hypothetical protein